MRVLWPWSSVEAPTRVTIRDVQPGDKVAFHGDSSIVSAEVAGLREGEQALLIYSTADGQSVDQTIPLTRAEGDYRHQCRFPPGNLGLQQDYDYYLAAGDYRTRRYQIEARIAPAIEFDKVSYHYPAYTGIADQTVSAAGRSCRRSKGRKLRCTRRPTPRSSPARRRSTLAAPAAAACG